MKKKINLMSKLLAASLAFITAAAITSCGREKVYHVTFDYDVNGVEDKVVDVAIKNGTLEIPSLGDVTKDNYVFLGWYYNGAPFTLDTEITQSITVTAKWHARPAAPSTISFDAATNLLTVTPAVTTITNYKIYLTRNNGEEQEISLTKNAQDKYQYAIDKTGSYKVTATSNDGICDSKKTNEYSFNVEEPDYNIIFKVDNETYATKQLSATHELTLPTAPATERFKKFSGWYFEDTYINAYSNEKLLEKIDFDTLDEQTVTLFAKFDTLTDLTAPSNIQVNADWTKLTFTAPDTNTDCTYYVTVKNGNTVIEEGTATNKEFALTTGSYSKDSTYTFDIVVKSNHKDFLNGDIEKTASISKNREDNPFTVSFVSYEGQQVEQSFGYNNNETIVNYNPNARTGYVFTGWVKQGTSEKLTATTTVTANVTYVGQWTKIENVNLAYDANKNIITFAEFDDIDTYISLDNGTTFVKASSGYFIEGAYAGYQFSVKVKYVNADSTSEVVTDASSFTASKIVVKLAYTDQVKYVLPNEFTFLSASDIPAVYAAGKTFAGWHLDENVDSAKYSLYTYSFAKSTTMYGLLIDTPEAIDVDSIEYNEATGKLVWEEITGASKYLVKFGTSAEYVETTVNELSINLVASGNYPVHIKYIIDGITSLEASTDLEINFTTTVRYESSSRIISVATINDQQVETRILLSGQTYNVGQVEFSASDYYTVSDGQLVVTKDATLLNKPFTFTQNGTTYNGMVAANVQTISYGGLYKNFEDKKNTNVLLDQTSKYKVGTAANYREDICVEFDANYAGNSDYEDYLEMFDVVIKLNGTVNNDISLILKDEKYYLSFDKTYEDGTLEVILTPKYVNPDLISSIDETSKKVTVVDTAILKYTFELNAGINVFTSEELRVAVADNNIHCVNVIANEFVVYANANQLNEDGSLVNFGNDDKTRNGKVNGDVYRRELAAGEKFILNGNGVSINAENIPGVYNTGDYDDDQWPYVNDTPYFQSTHVSVFKFKAANTTPESASVIPLTYINDLIVKGNLKKIAKYCTDNQKSSEETTARQTGCLSGIHGNGSSIKLNNTVISECQIGLFGESKTNNEVNYTKLTNNFATGASIFASGIKFNHSLIKDNGGMAIYAEDSTTGENKDDEPHYWIEDTDTTHKRTDVAIMIDNNTVIDNFTTGMTGYFLSSPGIGAMIPVMKIMLSNQLLENANKAILKQVTVGNETLEAFNFEFFFGTVSYTSAGRLEYTFYNSDDEANPVIISQYCYKANVDADDANMKKWNEANQTLISHYANIDLIQRYLTKEVARIQTYAAVGGMDNVKLMAAQAYAAANIEGFSEMNASAQGAVLEGIIPNITDEMADEALRSNSQAAVYAAAYADYADICTKFDFEVTGEAKSIIDAMIGIEQIIEATTTNFATTFLSTDSTDLLIKKLYAYGNMVKFSTLFETVATNLQYASFSAFLADVMNSADMQTMLTKIHTFNGYVNTALSTEGKNYLEYLTLCYDTQKQALVELDSAEKFMVEAIVGGYLTNQLTQAQLLPTIVQLYTYMMGSHFALGGSEYSTIIYNGSDVGGPTGTYCLISVQTVDKGTEGWISETITVPGQ